MNHKTHYLLFYSKMCLVKILLSLPAVITKAMMVKLALLSRSYDLKVILQLKKIKPLWHCPFVLYTHYVISEVLY